MADRDVVDVLLDHLTDAVRENERRRIETGLNRLFERSPERPDLGPIMLVVFGLDTTG